MATTQPQLELNPFIGGKPVATSDTYEVRSPYDDALVAVIHRAGPGRDRGCDRRRRRAPSRRRASCPSWQRAEILEADRRRDREQRDDFARTIALEAGKPIKTARGEADRAAFTFKVAAEEAKRIYGEIVPLDWLPGNEGRTAHVRRVPLGPVAGITPFNFPLNLVAHKVAPALAAGNPIVLRPASQTPISAFKLAQIVVEAGWPEEGIAVVPSTTARRVAARRGPADQAADVHRQPGRRLGPEEPRRLQARHARARRQRGRDRPRRRRHRLRRRADRLGRHDERRPDLHLRAARLRPRLARRRSRTTSCSGSSSSSSATRSTRRPTSAR